MNISKLVFKTLKFYIFLLSSFFCGYGFIYILTKINFIIPIQASIGIGILITGPYFIGPKLINIFKGIKAATLYYPITEEKLNIHRQTYLNNVEKEFFYIQQAIDMLEYDDEYTKWLKKKKNRLGKIRDKITSQNQLSSQDLVFMNRMFNAKFYMRNKVGFTKIR